MIDVVTTAGLVALASCLFTSYCLYRLVDGFSSTSKMARNEGRKLTATALSNVGVAFVATGVVGPIIQATPSTPLDSKFDGVWFVAVAALGFLVHLVGRMVMAKLED